MRTKLIPLLFVTILLFSNSLQAKNIINLRLNFHKGSTYEMTTVLNNTSEQEIKGLKTEIDQKMTTGISFHVLDILPNKNFLIEYSIQKIKMNVKMDEREANYDSESNNGNNPMNSTLKTLPNIKIEISPLGKLISMESFKFDSIEGDPQVFQLLFTLLGNRNMESYIGQMFNYFPVEKVEKGKKWSNSVKLATVMSLETIMNFELVNIERNQLTLNITSDINLNKPIEKESSNIDMKMTGTQSGTMTIDTTDGWLRSYDLIQKFKINIIMKDPKTKEDIENSVISNSVTKFTVVKK